ncbi:MAG TPA: MBL fold metallo-hydrolase [Rectinemataceae bacterium]|nr:MBL fold metallo-hydrolase [Rectinemataceae bacterium]
MLVTALVDDYSPQRGFRGEHGLSRSGENTREIGLHPAALAAAGSRALVVKDLREIASGAWLAPAAARKDGSTASERYRRIRAGVELRDEFEEELSLLVVEGGALSIFTGCAHRGIGNIVADALSRFPGLRLNAVIGGFHLVDARGEDLERASSDLAGRRPERVFCSHCTGMPGYAALLRALPTEPRWLHCGAAVEL